MAVLHSLGWKGDKFYVNSATGWSIDRVSAWALQHLGRDSWDGSVPASSVVTGCGSGSIVGAVAVRQATEGLGYHRDAARKICAEISSGSAWWGLPFVPSQQVLQAGLAQHERRVSDVRRAKVLNYWHGPMR